MAEAQLTNTLAQVKQKQAVLRQAQIDVDRTYIRAPVTGTVVNRAVSAARPSRPACRLRPCSPLRKTSPRCRWRPRWWRRM